MLLRSGVPYVLAFAALASISCKGCAGGGGGAEPIGYVAKDASAVLELRDLGALAKNKKALAAAIADVVPPDQISALEKELELSLGFTPTTEQGLEAAGLPKEGTIAVEIAEGGTGALWIVPVKDVEKATKTIERIAKARASVDATEKIKIGDQDVTTLLSSFGPEKALVAAYTFHKGNALIAVGSKGRAMLERALAKKSDDGSVADNPEYTAIKKSLGDKWEARLISPNAGTSLTAALKTLATVAPARVARVIQSMPEIRGVKSAGWVLGFEERTVKIDGRVRLDDAALADMKAVFATKSPAPKGVAALGFEDAVVFAYFSGDPQAMIAKLAPAGSEARTRLDETFNRVKEDIDADLEKDVLPVLSGHAALAMGIGSLSGLDLRAMLENPASILWTVFSLGAADPSKLLDVEKKMDEGLKSKGLLIASRTTAGAEVRVLQGQREGQPPAMLVETVTAGGARIFSNDDKRTEAAVERAGGSPKDPHDGKAGLVVEARMNNLATAVRSLDFSALPMLYRALIGKAVQILNVFEKIEVRFTPAEDGIAFALRVTLMPPAPVK